MSTQESFFRKSNRHWLVLTAGLAVLAISTVLFLGGLNLEETRDLNGNTAVSQDTPQQIALPLTGPPLEVGDRPYDFTLADLEGNTVSLHEFIGQPLIINFWATWCAPCRIEMPHLQNTFETRRADGLSILALNQDEAVPDIDAFYEEFGLTFPALRDEGNQISQNYGVGRILPTTFFINAQGEITAVHRGPMTQSQIDGYLAERVPDNG